MEEIVAPCCFCCRVLVGRHLHGMDHIFVPENINTGHVTSRVKCACIHIRSIFTMTMSKLLSQFTTDEYKFKFCLCHMRGQKNPPLLALIMFECKMMHSFHQKKVIACFAFLIVCIYELLTRFSCLPSFKHSAIMVPLAGGELAACF